MSLMQTPGMVFLFSLMGSTTPFSPRFTRMRGNVAGPPLRSPAPASARKDLRDLRKNGDDDERLCETCGAYWSGLGWRGGEDEWVRVLEAFFSFFVFFFLYFSSIESRLYPMDLADVVARFFFLFAFPCTSLFDLYSLVIMTKTLIIYLYFDTKKIWIRFEF